MPDRNLAWRDKWVTQLVEVVSESIDPDALATFPDQDTQVTLSISLSQREYTRILSAMCVGAELAFPYQAQQIYYDFMKLTNGSLPVSCEDIADCIEEQLATNDALVNSITETINQNGFGNPNRVNPELTKIADRNDASFETDEIADTTTTQCDLDKLWAGIKYMVDRMDENLGDTLEDVAAIPTIIGKNAAWIDIIPVLGDIAEAVVTSLSSVVPTLQTLYESYSSEAVREEIACDLFSMVCNECRYPTHKEVYDYFKNFALPATPSIADWTLDIMTQLLTDPVGVAAKVAYFTLMTWQLGIIYLQASFNGASGTKTLVRWAGLGEDSPNNNWHDLCDGCHEEYAYVEYDYKTSDNNSYFVPGFFGTNQYTRIGGRGVIVQEGQNAASIGLPLDPSWKIRTINVKMSKSVPTNYSSRELHLRPTPRTSTGQTTLSSVNCTDGLSFGRDALLDISGFSEFALRVAPATGSGVGYVEKITIYYKMPFAPTGAIPTTDAEPCT